MKSVLRSWFFVLGLVAAIGASATSGLSLRSAALVGTAGTPAAGSGLTQSASGLLLQDGFSSLSAWNLFGGSAYSADSSAPSYLIYPHDRVFMDLGGSGAPDERGLREPKPYQMEDGSLTILYDAADGTNAWGAAIATSTDNGLTITRHGLLSLPNPEEYFSICQTFVFKHSGTYYLEALNATVSGGISAEPGVPGNPYGNSLYSTPNLVTGPYTLVSDQDPPLQGGDTNSAYQIFYDSVALEWVMHTACQTDPWHTGKATSTSPLGPWTMQDTDLLPANVEGSTYGGAENFIAWPSTALGCWVGTANMIPLSACGLYFADTYADFASNVRHVTGIWPSTRLDESWARNNVSPSSPIFDLSHNVIEDSNGYVGWLYGGDNANVLLLAEGHRLRAGQLEPSVSAMKFVSPGGTVQYATRDLGAADFVAEFAVEIDTWADADIGFLFNASAAGGTDGGTTGLLLNLKANSAGAQLYTISSGSFSQVATGNGQAAQFIPDALNKWHWKIKVTSVGGVVTVLENGAELLSYDAGAPLTGTICGFRSYQSNYRLRGFSARASDTVTITGLTNGDAVSLHGAGKLPAVSGTASGSSITLTHSHFPLFGVQINGTYYPYPDGIWGGDAFAR